MEAPAGTFWIGSPHPFDLHECYVNFRHTAQCGAKPVVAQLFITADCRYRLWVNGHFVGRGPSRCWPHAQQVDVIDVAPYLHAGSNTLAVQIYSPGYSHFAAVHRAASGVMAWLIVDGDVSGRTNGDWRVARDHSWRSDVPRISIYGSGVERRDLRLAETWMAPGFDDSAWAAARIVAGAAGPLWTGLAARDVPLLRETTRALSDPWRTWRGSEPVVDEPHAALRVLWLAKGAEGPARIWIFDLGASRVCQGIAEIRGAAGGERLLISYAEKLRDGDVLLSDPTTYCRMQPTDEFILRPGAQTAEGFTLRGARYLIFALCGDPNETVDASFSVRCSDYPLDEVPLIVEDSTMQRIADMCRRTLLSCLQDGFVDSVWRESSQWLGDGVAQAFALAAISSDQRPLRRLITMAADGVHDDGMLPSVLPGEVHAYTITDYAFSWIELLAMYQGQDRAALLQTMAQMVERLLDRLAKDVGSDGLIRSEPGRRLFIDWSGVDRREPNLTYNARYLNALQVAQGLGLRNVSDQITRLRHAIVSAFETGDGWQENPFGTPASQLGLAFLLLTGCAKRTVADAVVARSLDLDDGATPGKLVLASPFMHHYVFQALHALGRNDDILAIIRARWGRWANAGEPTTWENWAIDFPDGSACHGFSAHPLGWLKRLSGVS